MILIALGANLSGLHGSPRQAILKALGAMKANGIRVLACSPVYLTAPVPISDQPWYHNAVALIKTHLLPHDLLKLLNKIENDFGRIRSERNAPRILDLDILDYHGKQIDEPDLILPHPRMQDRAFVLYPLRDIVPDWKHPILREWVGSLISRLPKEQEIRNDSLPMVMGIVNVTPDSFSDGGKYSSTDAAVRHGKQLVAEGASILDIGGESTRPGAEPVGTDEELKRVIPVLEGLQGGGAWLSVDTRRAEVMRAALETGVQIINDVSALEGDKESLSVVAKSRAHLCLMHMKDQPQTMQDNPVYENVVAEIHDYLAGRVRVCMDAGIAPDRLMIDVGIGFGKTTAHNVELLKSLGTFRDLGVRILLGASRKRFIPDLCGHDIAPVDRLAGSLAAVSAALHHRADIVRVHDVAQTCQFLEVARAIIPKI